MSEINNNYAVPVDIFAMGNMNSLAEMGVKENMVGPLQFNNPAPPSPMDSNYSPVPVTENHGPPAPPRAGEANEFYQDQIKDAADGANAVIAAIRVPDATPAFPQIAPVSIPQPPATAPAVLAPAVTAPAATVAAQPQLGWSDTQALAYIASYGDLMNIIGPSAAGGAEHYITHGKGEGRATTFDPVAYLAANPDVAAYHTGDAASVTMHYIQYGRFENRLLAPAPVAVALPALPDPPSAPVTAAPPPAPEPSPGMLPQPEIILPTIPWHPAAPTIPEMNIPEHAAAPVVPATPSVTHDLCEFVRLEKEKAYEEYVARIIAQQAVTLHEIQLGVNATLALRYDPARVLQEYLQNNRPDNRT